MHKKYESPSSLTIHLFHYCMLILIPYHHHISMEKKTILLFFIFYRFSAVPSRIAVATDFYPEKDGPGSAKDARTDGSPMVSKTVFKHILFCI